MVTLEEFQKLMHLSEDEEINKLLAKVIYEELDDRNFFTLPASINHHGNKDGELFNHSLCVMNELVNLTEKLDLQWELERSPYVVGMLHDLCKTELYVPDGNGGFKYNNESFMTGHGDLSVLLSSNIGVLLTEEEIACIRWHMGAFDDSKNWNKYNLAIQKYPNVLYTHTADMIASQIKNV